MDLDGRIRESLEGLEEATETLIKASRLSTRPILITFPIDGCEECQILVRPGVEPEVDVRPHPQASWRPLAHEGGSFEVRDE